MGQAALLAAGTNLATAIPAGPGYVGTFELAVVTIAASVGIPSDQALAFGILVHVTVLLVTSVGGAIAFMLGGRRRPVPGTSATVHGDHTAADDAPQGAHDHPDDNPRQVAPAGEGR
jgi:hypothetical protein